MLTIPEEWAAEHFAALVSSSTIFFTAWPLSRMSTKNLQKLRLFPKTPRP